MFRVHETTVFTNATRPPKVVKLIQKAVFLHLSLAPKVDLADEKVVARWWQGGWQGGGKVGVKVATGIR